MSFDTVIDGMGLLINPLFSAVQPLLSETVTPIEPPFNPLAVEMVAPFDQR